MTINHWVLRRMATFAAVSTMTWSFLAFSQEGISTREVMKLKLHYTQRVLEGLAIENFDLILTNAQNLSFLSQAANWEVRQTREYQIFTANFRHHAESLVAAAKRKNVDAATVAYFQLTVSCVNCHRYLRDAKMARLRESPERWNLR